ncbi:phosphoheptose isomerase, partial [Salmonella enterica subsp. enterica serovar Typhimurium]|nr:phosphoheptose isomerase [Salmonella enterica subsp. enterica serovar Typhimurium]
MLRISVLERIKVCFTESIQTQIA